MRIKKIENVVGLVGHVLKQSTKSDVNTYSANYLNDRITKVSLVEPTTGEKLWVQASKNLFDTKLLVQGGWDASYRQDKVSWGMKVKAGVIYTITNYSQKTISIFETENLTQDNTKNSVLGEHGKITGTGNMTLTTLSDGYLRLLFNNSGDTNLSVSDILSSDIQIEQGSAATEYEPYVKKKIFIKNDNNVYDEFYNESGIVESGSDDNGDWIKFANGTMIVAQTYSKFQDCVDAFGNFYSTVNNILPDFPVTFKEKPRIIKATTTDGCFIISGPTSTSVSSPGSVKFLEINKVQRTYTANVIAIGKWK